MALSIALYSFPKRYNSTARPTGSGRAVEVVLKKGTSTNNPTFILSGRRPTENYCTFNGAYYFIEDVISLHDNLFEVVCGLDVLATAKDEITASSAYVEYRTGGYRDLPDNRVGIRVGDRTAAEIGDVGFTQSGHYVLSAVGDSGVTVWEIGTAAQLAQVLSNVAEWADNLVNGATDIVSAVQIAGSQLISQGSAADCIRDCRWLPFPSSGGVGGFISLGRYNTGVAAGSVQANNPYRSGQISITAPFSRSGFLRTPPYSEVCIYLPFVGVVNISSALFANTSAVQVYYSMDYRSGAIAYRVVVGGHTVGSFGGDSSVTIPVGVSNVSPTQLITGITQATMAGAYGNYAAALGSVIGSFSPTINSTGGISGGAGIGITNHVLLEVVEHPTSGAVGNMDEVQGTPYFNTVSLGDISGYVQTRGAAISTALRGSLKDTLNNMLDSGIFIE